MIKDRVKELEELKKLREEGKFPGIPIFHKYTRFGDYMPALIKGVMYLVTAHSGVGKTQFWKDFFLFLPIQIMKAYPKYGIKLKFIIFLLEESKTEFIDNVISGLLWREKKIAVDPLELKSMKKTPVSREILNAIREIQPLIDEVLDMCELHEDIYNPYGMYKEVRNYAYSHGKVIKEEKEFTHKREDGTLFTEKNVVFKKYVPEDPNEYVFVITDHISLLQEERDGITGKMLDLRETMEKWSFHYCRKYISKNFNYIVVNIQQQLQSSDQQQFTGRGNTIVEKLKPSSSTLADCKTTYRDHLVVLALFNPSKYNIPNYFGYDLTKLPNCFRSIIVLKNRIGRDGLEVPLYFKGSSNYFKELPRPDKINYKDYESKM